MATILRMEIPEAQRGVEVEGKLGARGSWCDLGRQFYNFGCDVSVEGDPEGGDEEWVVLEFDPPMIGCVRSLVEQAAEGVYGSEAQTFWSALDRKTFL